MYDHELHITARPILAAKTAELLPFPLTKRRAYILRHAERMVGLPAKTARNISLISCVFSPKHWQSEDF